MAGRGRLAVTADTDVDVQSVLIAAIFSQGEGASIRLLARPGAKREGIDISAAGLRLKIRAPANDGKANARILEVLASFLQVPKSSLAIVRGGTSREKTISCHAASADRLRACFRTAAHLGG